MAALMLKYDDLRLDHFEDPVRASLCYGYEPMTDDEKQNHAHVALLFHPLRTMHLENINHCA